MVAAHCQYVVLMSPVLFGQSGKLALRPRIHATGEDLWTGRATRPTCGINMASRSQFVMADLCQQLRMTFVKTLAGLPTLAHSVTH
jgi:hypothetical protein